MHNKLLKQISYAKTSVMAMRSLYEAHGAIKMAFELKAITEAEYFELNHECVYKGINNPQYFERD
jgi:hypothetical protein